MVYIMCGTLGTFAVLTFLLLIVMKCLDWRRKRQMKNKIEDGIDISEYAPGHGEGASAPEIKF